MNRKYNRELPRNLTYRKKYKKFYWRNPVNGKEFPLDGLSKSQAIAQAIEANNYIANNFTPSALLERIKSEKEMTMANWLERYNVILNRRELAANTYKARAGHIATIGERMGSMVLKSINTRHIADFLDPWIAEGKKTMAGVLRSVLIDIFREAIAEGHLTLNPVEPTRTPKIVVHRQRLSLESYKSIRSAADNMPPWLSLAMDLAFVTAQRREDVANMRFSEICDDRLHVTQIKTGAMIAIPLSLSLNGLRLGTIIDRCRLASRTDFLISAGIRKNSPDGSVHLDSLTKGFVKARKNSGESFSDHPPSFHEIRSLSGRLHEDISGKDYVQKLFGHRSEKMTEKYLDVREKVFTLL
ncbi:TPA: phage integrase Arm DNA-binding domain-containing protein [Citrobacter amalonaticus]|nr:phage integrase Arm DNA-binding domain-containing protein [Citrobacter amalonaticus]